MHSRILLIAGHLAGALLFLSIPVLLAPVPPLEAIFSFNKTQEEIMAFAMLILFFYLNYYYLAPRFYARRKFALFYILLLTAFLIIHLLPEIMFHGLLGRPGPEDAIPFRHRQIPFYLSLFGMIYHLFLFTAVAFISLAIYLNNQWKQALQEKVDAELSFLKSQVNPHFLFNSLNSIYSLSLQKSDDTPAAIVRLSGLMRYVLTDAQDEYVSVSQELEYIKNYIELQKIRVGNTASIIFELENDNSADRIAPLLLIPFIENTFKYGINPEKKSELKILIQVYQKNLTLTSVNNKVAEAGESTGTGIGNTLKRLDHFYSKRYHLDITDTPTSYHITLKLQL